MTAAPASARPPGTVLAHAEAAYLGLALGDALGATVEFMTPREIVHHYAHGAELGRYFPTTQSDSPGLDGIFREVLSTRQHAGAAQGNTFGSGG
ncbi:MAG: ADP-ribosyl-[dinitrogen reductase] hydrolase [Candidatus Accumulibacter phosphatis]|uniref:ADP-ribosyl-[dinitrogen reductase] hydrolase n=1 Tax=Candidatus Accumulibacter phosphatis TaxID=327160 RepID=A0A080LT88_9PROT|nr:MAG: ADP-ribosyl-[dinitrogen reductase] hydrolase [Candidatus Accumulibacter phosphatis]